MRTKTTYWQQWVREYTHTLVVAGTVPGRVLFSDSLWRWVTRSPFWQSRVCSKLAAAPHPSQLVGIFRIVWLYRRAIDNKHVHVHLSYLWPVNNLMILMPSISVQDRAYEDASKINDRNPSHLLIGWTSCPSWTRHQYQAAHGSLCKGASIEWIGSVRS